MEIDNDRVVGNGLNTPKTLWTRGGRTPFDNREEVGINDEDIDVGSGDEQVTDVWP